MITIKALLHRYQSGEISPQKHVHDLLDVIRHNFHEGKDPAWICVATESNISKQSMLVLS